MAKQLPAEAAEAYATTVVKQDYAAFLRSMTPDALMKAMDVEGTSWSVLSYEISPHGQEGDRHIFDVTFQTDKGTLPLRLTFGSVDGEWKVVDVEALS